MSQHYSQEELASFQFQSFGSFKLVQADPSVSNVLGWSPDEMIVNHSQWIELVHPDDRPNLLAALVNLDREVLSQQDYRIQSKAVVYRWVRSQFLFAQTPQALIHGTWIEIHRLRQSKAQINRYIRLLEASLEATFYLMTAPELSEGMNKALARLGVVMQVDRIYFLSLSSPPKIIDPSNPVEQTGCPSNLFAWARHDPLYRFSPGDWLKQSVIQADALPIWTTLLQGQTIQGDLTTLSPAIRRYLEPFQIFSILLLPIFRQDFCLGILGLETTQTPKHWFNKDIQVLRQLTTTMEVALKQLNDENSLSHHAFHDPLTNLPNRALLLNRLEQCLKRKERDKNYSFAVLFLDLDRFKPINDRLGHQVGDHLLIQVAHRISRCIRPGDTMARLGGDEFVILLDDIQDVSDAESVVKRLQQELTEKFLIETHELYVDVSIGVALSSTQMQSAETILRNADLAMYRAKNSGKGCYRIFESSMHSHMMQQSKTESQMRLALKRNQFVAYYQPIVCLESGLIKGFEALVRWNHPEMGLLYPNQFIPIAEETGMIKVLGMQVLQSACMQASLWHKAFPFSPALTMNVNISAKQFVQKDLVANIQQILEETQLPPSCLHLELTESCIIEKDAETLNVINQLRNIGIYIYLDDFGAGYSSLQYLNFLPLNGLKIDRAFTQKIATSVETQAIVRSILVMGQALNMDIVVEGIENNQQVEYLSDFKSLSGQGFLFSRPLPVENVQKLLLQKSLELC